MYPNGRHYFSSDLIFVELPRGSRVTNIIIHIHCKVVSGGFRGGKGVQMHPPLAASNGSLRK